MPLIRALIRWYINRPAVVDTRLLGNWCDYRPAHRLGNMPVKGYIIDQRGRKHEYGQSCFKHSGQLAKDSDYIEPGF